MKVRRPVKQLLGIVVILVAVLLVGACAQPTPAPPTPAPTPTPTPAPAPTPETFEFKLAFPYPPGDEMGIGPEFMAAELEKRTGGRVKITIFPGGALGKMPDSLDMLETGIADMAVFPPSVFPKVFRILDALTLPGIRLPNRALAQETVYQLYYNGLLDKEYAGFKPLLWEGTDTFGFVFKEKITTLEELRKMKIRSPAGISTQVVEALGCTVVSIPIPDVYMALDRGVADGLVAMRGSFISFKLYELTKYWLWLPMGCGANVVAMTQDKWDSLPLDIQVIWEQVNNETKYYFLEEADRRQPPVKEHLEQLGLEIYTLSPDEEARWYAIFDTLTEQWIADTEAAGYPAKDSVATIQRSIRRYMEQ